jgi:hypothetical protein
MRGTLPRGSTRSVGAQGACRTGRGRLRWRDYEQDLKANVEDLQARIHRGAYRPKPSRRVSIEKADGRQRPLAVAGLEDKIVQRATAAVLNAIYEEDFLGFSYGFRPGRGAHDALDALVVAIESRKVNFIVDADIRRRRTSAIVSSSVRTIAGRGRGKPQAARVRQAGNLQRPGLHLHLRRDPPGQGSPFTTRGGRSYGAGGGGCGIFIVHTN